jgi:hypothetical protein
MRLLLYIYLAIYLFTLNSFGQNIIVSNDTIKYLSFYPSSYNIDTLVVYNTGNNILSIDSLENFNRVCNYVLTYEYKDSLKKSTYLGFGFNASKIHFPVSIPPTDSALLIFQYFSPILKMSRCNTTNNDSIIVYNNSINCPSFIIYVLSNVSNNVDNGINILSCYSLQQNYPNPFNPMTSISFTLPLRSHALLTICNMLGSEITRMIDKDLEPGIYTVTWNSTGNSSGIYFYSLKAGNIILTKKMILLK